MSTPVSWPIDVNQNHLLGTINDQPDDNVARYAPEVGPPKLRRRTSIGVDTVAFDQICTRAEWISLKRWYRDVLREALSFFRKNPRTCEIQEFIFIEPPAARELTRDRYVVTLRLKSMP
jgi:hypothetical protein